MKIYLIFLLLFSFLTLTAFEQAEKTVSINDLRKEKVSDDQDISTAGHQVGDLIVNRVLKHGEGVNEKNGLLELYDIRFFQYYKGKLKNFLLSYNDPENYDKASYHWINDKEVSVTLFTSFNPLTNSAPPFKSKTLRLVQIGDRVTIMNDGFEDTPVNRFIPDPSRELIPLDTIK